MEESALSNFLHNKWVWLVFALDVIAVIVIIILMALNNTKTATLVLNVTPDDAKVTLNGEGNYGNGTYSVYPGNYKVAVSRDGLDTKTFDLVIQKGENASVTTFLTHEGNIDFYKSRNQRSSFEKLYGMASLESNQTTDRDTSIEDSISSLHSDSIAMQSLPINEVLYENTDSGRKLVYDITIRANNSDECQTWLCLEALVLGTDDKSIVTDILNAKRFKVEDYEIKYKMY